MAGRGKRKTPGNARSERNSIITMNDIRPLDYAPKSPAKRVGWITRLIFGVLALYSLILTIGMIFVVIHERKLWPWVPYSIIGLGCVMICASVVWRAKMWLD
jgi:hypothetical protein